MTQEFISKLWPMQTFAATIEKNRGGFFFPRVADSCSSPGLDNMIQEHADHSDSTSALEREQLLLRRHSSLNLHQCVHAHMSLYGELHCHEKHAADFQRMREEMWNLNKAQHAGIRFLIFLFRLQTYNHFCTFLPNQHIFYPLHEEHTRPHIAP